MEQKIKINHIVELFTFFSLFTILFIAPLKFSMPLIEGVSRLYPENITEWIFFYWPVEILAIFIIFLASFFILKTLLKEKFLNKKTPLDIFHAIFILILVLSTIFSKNLYRSIPFTIQTISSILLFYLIIYAPDNRNSWPYIFLIITSAAVIISLYGVYQYAYGLEETRTWFFKQEALSSGLYQSKEFLRRLLANRIFSTFVYPNSLAGYLVLTLPFVLGIFLLKPTTFKYRSFVYIILITSTAALFFLITAKKLSLTLPAILLIFSFPLLPLISLFLTFSKGGGATLFLLFFLFLYLLFKKNALKKHKKTILIASILAVIIFSFLSIQGFLGETIPQRIKAPTLKARIGYFTAALKIAAENPLLGTGPATFGIFYPQYKSPQNEETQMTHNNYLQIAAETGILGFASFCLIWFTALKEILKQLHFIFLSQTKTLDNRQLIIISSGFSSLAFITHSLIDFDLYVPSLSILGWGSLGIFFRHTLIPQNSSLIIKNKALKYFLILLTLTSSLYMISLLRKNFMGDYAFEIGKNLFKNQHHEEAIQKIKEATVINPQAAPFYFYLSRTYAAEKKYSDAIYYCKQAIVKSPYTAYYHHYLGKLYYLLEKVDKKDYNIPIITELSKAITYHPSNTNYIIALARYYQEKKETQKAIKIYEQALSIKPQDKNIKKQIISLNQGGK